MTAKSRESRKANRRHPSLLDEVLERRMLLYVLAAGAALAGVGAGTTEGKVIFTPSSVALTNRGCVFERATSSLEIDLNNDGTTDFTINDSCTTIYITGTARRRPLGSEYNVYFLSAQGAVTGNSLESAGDGRLKALPDGARIPMGNFAVQGNMVAQREGSNPSGSFVNVQYRFLGVRFLINGQVHYGWIGFRSVKGFTATLYGWAYETEPNTPIFAGLSAAIGELEKQPALPSAEQPALRSTEPTSLQLLAAGHVAVADWRRRNAAVVAPVASPS